MSRLFNSAVLISVAFSAAAESHDGFHSLSHAALETVGSQSLVNDPDQRFLFHEVKGQPETGLTLHVASGSAFVELSFDLVHSEAADGYRLNSGDVTVRSVSCNGRNFPGINMVVLGGIGTILPAPNQYANEFNHVEAMIAQLNLSDVLNGLIRQHCAKAFSQANIAAKNYGPILRTQNTYLQVKRTVEPAETRLGNHRAVTSAFIVTESFPGREQARFHLERSYFPSIAHNTIRITPLTGPIREARFIRTTLIGDDWADVIARTIPYTLYRVYGSIHGWQ